MENAEGKKKRNCLLGAISPFPIVFSSLVLQICKIQGLFGKKFKLSNSVVYINFIYEPFLTLSPSIPYFNSLLKTLWKKRENAGHQRFLLFRQCFQPFQKLFYFLQAHLFVVHKSYQFGQVSKFVI